MPEGIVIDETVSDVRMFLVNCDVINVRAATRDFHNLVRQILFSEPLPIFNVLTQRLLLARQTEPNFGEEPRRGCTGYLQLSNIVLVFALARQNSIIEQNNLDSVYQLLTG